MSVSHIVQNDRILLRDRPWIVRNVQAVTGDRHLLKLEALDGDEPAYLDVAVPPEEPQLLPAERPVFDLGQLDSLAGWANAHRILAATLIQTAGLVSGGRFGRVALEAYQLAPTLQLLSKPRPSLLIADDVGLGKTIEAGLAMLELMARGRVRRVLVVVPPGLMEQWRQELFEKFGLEFYIIGNASELVVAQESLPAGVSPWDALPRVITSIDYLKKDTVRARALRRSWDLVIVDEAHALAESGSPQNPYRTQRTRLGIALRETARSLLLLTATPHNGYAHSFRSLLELVEPTLATFKGSHEDLRRRVETTMIRRMKAQIRRRVNGQEEPVFPPRTVEGVPVPLSDAEKRLLREISAYCAQTLRQARGVEDEELVGFAMQIVKKRALSSRQALLQTIEHRLEALEREDAREEPPRPAEVRDFQADLPQTESQSEQTARRILRSAIPRDEVRRGSELRTLKRIRTLLKKISEPDAKLETLVSELKGMVAQDPFEKVIVFTEYRDTLDAIRARLDVEPELQGRYVMLHGGLTRRERLRRQNRFAQPETQVLLATDAASEGLNLQEHCRRVIHMELPWNPNRLEQRNGRVDRYGQRRPPIIRYLYYPDSPEDDVLARLVKKIEQMTRDYVSTPDILGVIQGAEAIKDGLTSLDAEAPDIEVKKESLVRLFEDRTHEFVRELQPLLMASQEIKVAAPGILGALQHAEPLLSDDLMLEEAVVAILGPDAIRPVEGLEGIYRIEVPWAYRGDGVEALYEAATFRRSAAARYRADEVAFITPLHPLVKALAADARRRFLQVYPNARGLPPRRLAARTVPPQEPTSVVFTWLGRLEGGGGLVEEHLIPIRVDLNGQILGQPEENQRWLIFEATSDVSKGALEALFRNRFDDLLQRAQQAAESWLQERARALRQERQDQAAVLRQALERDVADRLQEIEEEERLVQGLIEASGQQRLFPDREVSGFNTRRQVLESFRQQRLEEIAAFEQVHDLTSPQPLGALFLVPEGGEA